MYVQRTCPWCTRKHAGAPFSFSTVQCTSVQSSLQSSGHLGTSGHFCTQLEHSWIHLEHSWSTAGVHLVCGPETQLEHIWCAVQMHSWSTARTSGTHLAYSPSAHLDTFGANLGTAGHTWCAEQGHMPVDSAVYSPGYHPVYILHTAHVQSRVASTVHPMYSPGYCPVYIPCTIPFTVQCMVQYTFQYTSSEQSSIYQFTSSIQSSVGSVFLCLSSPHP